MNNKDAHSCLWVKDLKDLVEVEICLLHERDVAIFQPGILSHPQHAMAPDEYKLSQDVLIFLIENQDHFLIGMQGTAADEKTVQEVESGPPTPASVGRGSACL